MWLALNCFACYVNKNGQQSNGRARGMKLEGVIYCGDNLYWMSRLPDEFVDLCYIRKPQI